MYYRNAAQRCLALPEIIHEIGRCLVHPDDLLDASCVNKLWKEVLVPLRAHFPHVYLGDLPSFLLFLKSNPRAAHSCHGLRILADDLDDETQPNDTDEDDEDEPDWDGESMFVEGEANDEDTPTTAGTAWTQPTQSALSTSTDLAIIPRKDERGAKTLAVADVLDYLADRGGLEFLMYALPGEPYEPLPDSALESISRMSNTLQGMYIELVGMHWKPFLKAVFPKIRYLRLFLDSDDFEINVPEGQRTNPNDLLLDFLRAHPLLEVLHIYIGKQFSGLSLNNIRLPNLRSFLLISKAEDVSLDTFIRNHPSIVALDAFTDTPIDSFSGRDLPHLRSLQVSSLTASWYRHVIASMPMRRPEERVHHLQITAARHSNLDDVLQIVAPLGPTLRCLELIFWTREGQIERVLNHVKEIFPNLVELSLFIPSWSVSDEEEPPGPLQLGTLLQSYASSSSVRALSISDPQSAHVSVEEIERLMKEMPYPPNLQYIAWRSQTFRVQQRRAEGEGDVLIVNAKHVGHPRNYRGSNFLRDWYEEMIFDHLTGDYDAQAKFMPK